MNNSPAKRQKTAHTPTKQTSLSHFITSDKPPQNQPNRPYPNSVPNRPQVAQVARNEQPNSIPNRTQVARNVQPNSVPNHTQVARNVQPKGTQLDCELDVNEDDDIKRAIDDRRREAFGRRIAHRLKEETWKTALDGEFTKSYWKNLVDLLAEEHNGRKVVFPPEELIFNAFNCCPWENVKVVIIGQDPYPGIGQAMGLSFSVPYGCAVPASLKNIFTELQSDIPGFELPNHGNLEKWAKQGVLLLNAVLTVRKGEPDSHANKGWEQFTDQAIKVINERRENIIFLLWGKKAQNKMKLINAKRHHILKCAHPSPLSVKDFYGCKHFSQANGILQDNGLEPIDWTLEQFTPSPNKKRTREDMH